MTSPSPTGRNLIPWQAALLGAAAVLVLLGPWWKHHGYLRDFYDYGLVMAGVGRIDAGERPYVDFVTPIQTGLFLFNGWAEQLGDGTYQAMTRGAAGLTVLAVVGLLGIYVRRWGAGAATALAAAFTAMTAAQHTIIWHNTLGALCIAVAAGSAAVAPVWIRAQWPWHLLTAAALVIGGLTKLNAHLVAVAGVVAWALYAGSQRRATWSRVAATLGGVALCAVVIPVAVELLWTRADVPTWWYNVVALPFSSRSGDLAAMLDVRFYLAVHHDYYGALPMPQVGALGLAVTAAFAVTGIRQRGRSQAGWVVGAALFAAAAGAGLLATNYEIAYVAMGAWFALLAALWVGFGLRSSGVAFYGGLLGPALLVGVLAWLSAWEGQRSQFGYSRAARSEYRTGEAIGADFAYLRGTSVPPETAQSMQVAAARRAAQPAADRTRVFYGPGAEWLERIWPTYQLPGMPLWMHGGTSYGAAEVERLREALSAGGPYLHVIVPEARDHWGPRIAPLLAGKYELKRMGPVWFRYDQLPPGIVSWQPLEFQRPFGGNVNAMLLESFMPVQTLADGRTFLGVDRAQGEVKVLAPSNRMQAEAVLRRAPGVRAAAGAVVRFEAFSVAGGNSYPRGTVELAPGADRDEQVLTVPVDSGGSPVRLVVTIPPELAGQVTAGWRALNILHAVDGPAAPSVLRSGARDIHPAGAEIRAALLPADWSPPEVHVRDVQIGPDGLELRPGGEIWIRLAGLYQEISGVATVVDRPAGAVDPVLRVVYFKGPKLDVLVQSAIRAPADNLPFKAWSAERDGWLVLMLEPYPTSPAVRVRLTGVRAAE